MKVRITFDITDDQRIAIAAQDGEFRPATREEIVEHIEDIVGYRLATLGSTYRQAMDDIIAKLNNPGATP